MAIPRPEHPKPQFERQTWENLNGPWQFDIDLGASNPHEYQTLGKKLPKEIILPFCPESDLSGIGYKDFMPTVWYKRNITVTKEQLEGRVLLHFGAVDYLCTIWVNGKEAGKHKGGYVSFAIDITKYLKAGENEITVRADDDLRSGKQPRGKQCPRFYSSGCEYTRTTGIWQTVWLEFVPKAYLKRVKVDTDYKTGTVSFASEIANAYLTPMKLKTTVSYNGEKVAECEIDANSTDFYSLNIPQFKLWNVGAPELYDVTYELTGDGICDTVNSYFGIRGVEVSDRAILINGKPVFQRLVLDQGFYPDGIYTAPTDEALKHDIELSMEFGFNGARLHQKVFEERFLYWADKLGYIVWDEHACWGLDYSDPLNVYNFLPEWVEIVERDYNHPALIGWCPFNETWDFMGRPQYNDLLKIVYTTTKALDKTRPCIDTSGNFHVVTDIYDIHEYDQDINVIRERYDSTKVGESLFDYHGQWGRQHYTGEPIFVSEYGGTWWSPGKEGGWGYGNAPKTEEEVCQRFCDITSYFLLNENFCAFCYTQITDVEQEQNGVYTYERKRKFSDETYAKMRAVLTQKAAIEK